MNKIIFHIDMDSFFVSCERSINTNLIDKPVVIAKRYKRSIISAMSYEVKNLGYRVGSSLYTVLEKVPNLLIVEPHYDLYSLISKKIFDYLKNKYCTQLEIYSIDECYIDFSNTISNWEEAKNLAQQIKDDILKTFMIPCSIGISFTKFLAKMSTNKAKPSGILITKKEDIERNFYSLPVEKIFGVGKNISQQLIKNKISTYKDLLECNNEIFLRKLFKKNFFLFIEQLKGINATDHILNLETKGISNTITFMEKDSDDIVFLKNELFKLARNVANRAVNNNYECRCVEILIRKQDKKWMSEQRKIDFFTNDIDIIFKIALKLFLNLWNEKECLRGLGIRICDLRSIFQENKQVNLFEDNNQKSIVNSILNEVNTKFEGKILITGKQYLLENSIDIDNIKFLRKNNQPYDKKINLEEKK